MSALSDHCVSALNLARLRAYLFELTVFAVSELEGRKHGSCQLKRTVSLAHFDLVNSHELEPL